MATLTVPPTPFSPHDDAIQLYKAFKGFGCDAAEVISIVAHRDATQRAHIQHEYRRMYSDDVLKRLSSELSGNLQIAISLWMHDPAARDATILKKSLTKNFINLETVTEVICSRTSSQLQYLKQIYHSTFGTYLENDIELQAMGHHEKVVGIKAYFPKGAQSTLELEPYIVADETQTLFLQILLACLSKPRYEGMEVDREMAAKDAKALYKAGEKKLGTDEKVFVHIFSERSRAHLVAINSFYHDMYGGSLKKAIKSETSGLFEHALLTILQCAENPAKYFAKVLNKSMKGLGTADTTLIRVIVTRTEIDMQYIKAEYHKKYKKTLNDDVQSETSGHYQIFLLSLLGPNH